jgi:hypothetical protein
MEKQFVLKAKTAVKRVAAISAGATMMGATLMGAVAADLGDYPSPFVQNGELNGVVVVGADAQMADMAGAGNLIATLTQATVSAASGTTVTEGGEDIEVALNAAFTAASFDDEDITGLLDDEVNFNDSDYTYKEEIFVGTGLKILTSGAEDEEDFGSNSYLGTTSASVDSFGYHFVFDDDVSALEDSAASAVTADDSLTIPFLGSSIELTDIQDDDTISFNLATSIALYAGESATVNGKVITLENVGTSNIVVDVDGVSDIVSDSSTETVNGIKIKVDAIFDADNLNERYARILAGDDISQTVTDGDVFELFGLSDDSDENPWVWDIDTSSMSTEATIGVTWAQQSNELGDDFPPYAMGEKLSLPNDYGYVVFDSYTSDDYTTYTVHFDESKTINDGSTSEGKDVIRFTSSADDGFTVTDEAGESEDIDEVYFFHNATDEYYAWKPEGEDWVVAAHNDSDVTFSLQYDNDDTAAVTLSTDEAAEHNFTIASYGDVPAVTIYTTNTTEEYRLGDSEDEEADEVTVGSDTVGTKDYDLLFTGGLIVENPESNGNGAGQVVLRYPSEAMDANVIVGGPGTSTTSTEYSSVTVNSVAGQTVVMLDNEVTDYASRNLILVGGPAVNTLTARVMGLDYPAEGAASGIPENAAIIRMYENAFGGSNTALVVAGWAAADTRAATSVLQNYRAYANQLNGRTEVQVSGTSVTAVGGDVATE